MEKIRQSSQTAIEISEEQLSAARQRMQQQRQDDAH
jgi:hypothetical protein